MQNETKDVVLIDSESFLWWCFWCLAWQHLYSAFPSIYVSVTQRSVSELIFHVCRCHSSYDWEDWWSRCYNCSGVCNIWAKIADGTHIRIRNAGSDASTIPICVTFNWFEEIIHTKSKNVCMNCADPGNVTHFWKPKHQIGRFERGYVYHPEVLLR